MSDDLTIIGGSAGAVDLLLGRIPMISFYANTVAIPTSLAQVIRSIDQGKTADTTIAIPGLGNVPISSSTLSLTSDILGILAAGGVLAGAATAGAAITLSGLATAVAIAAAATANPAIRDALTDPNLPNRLKEEFDKLTNPATIETTVNSMFDAARNWNPPGRDPLTLDLDGDGLETVGINPAAPILFDHNADGIKTATGWESRPREIGQSDK